MDCRKSFWLASGLLAAMGCRSTTAPLPVTQSAQQTNQPVAVTVHATPGPGDVVQPKEPGEPIIPKPTTLVAGGDYFASAATNPKLREEQRIDLQKKAEASYKQAISLDKQHLPAYQGLARVYAARKNFPQAVATYRDALQLAPDNSTLWYELGICQLRQKDWSSAVGSITKAVDLQPDNKQYIEALAITLAKVGQPTESYLCFCRINDEATAHYKTARVLSHIGQPELAREHLQMALQANPGLEKARTLLSSISEQQATPATPIESAPKHGPVAPAVHTAPAQGSTSKYQPLPQGVVPVSQNVPADDPLESLSDLTVPEVPAVQPEAPDDEKVILPPPPAIPIRYETPETGADS